MFRCIVSMQPYIKVPCSRPHRSSCVLSALCWASLHVFYQPLSHCHGGQPGSCAFLRKHQQLLSSFLATTLRESRQANLLAYLLPAFLDAHASLRHSSPRGKRLCQVRRSPVHACFGLFLHVVLAYMLDTSASLAGHVCKSWADQMMLAHRLSKSWWRQGRPHIGAVHKPVTS